MNENLKYWDKVRTPPPAALKPIQAGRLKGKTDINPQWRYMALTETFGPCGIGWTYTIDRLWTEPGTDGQIFAFAQVSLRYRHEGEWSTPIPGIGGSMLIEKEKNGLFNSDEGFKMAVTDALSVALKMVGVAADIYMGMADGSKYQRQERQEDRQAQTPATRQLSPTQAKLFPLVIAHLNALFGDDVAAKKKECHAISGMEDYRKLDDDALKNLEHKLRLTVETDKDMPL